MVTNTLMWSATFRSFSHSCVMNDVLADLMLGAGVDMLSDIGIIVMAIPSITLELEFMVGVVVDVRADLLSDLLTVRVIGFVTASDIDILADENVNGLAAAMTP